jgi:hypothetical protein
MTLRVTLLLACLSVIGCNTVSSQFPLGEPAAVEDAKKLEGVWLSEDGDPLMVRHIKDNELRMGSLAWNEEESKFELEEAELLVTMDEERPYVNFKGLGAQEEKEYGFARVAVLESESIVLFFPKSDTWIQAVENKTLAGTVERGENATTAHLTATSEQLGEFLDPEKTSEQFEIDAAISLHRVQRVEEE